MRTTIDFKSFNVSSQVQLGEGFVPSAPTWFAHIRALIEAGDLASANVLTSHPLVLNTWIDVDNKEVTHDDPLVGKITKNFTMEQMKDISSLAKQAVPLLGDDVTGICNAFCQLSQASGIYSPMPLTLFYWGATKGRGRVLVDRNSGNLYGIYLPNNVEEHLQKKDWKLAQLAQIK